MTDSGLRTRDSVLVKIGGSTLGAEDTTLADIVALQRDGVSVVVVHGGGPAVTSWMDRQGLQAQFVRGLRVTDEASLEIVVAVLAGLVNKQLVAEVNARGGKAAGLSGADGPTLLAEVTDPTYGRVGQVREVRTELLRSVLEGGMVPFLSPVGLDVAAERPDAALLNINADTVAGEVAAALRVGRLVFLTDVPGVKGATGDFVDALSTEECRSLIGSGAIGGGMIPKVEACLRAAEAGATALIVDGRQPGALKAALQGTAQGTRVG